MSAGVSFEALYAKLLLYAHDCCCEPSAAGALSICPSASAFPEAPATLAQQGPPFYWWIVLAFVLGRPQSAPELREHHNIYVYMYIAGNTLSACRCATPQSLIEELGFRPKDRATALSIGKLSSHNP